jgi:hypothetical protein
LDNFRRIALNDLPLKLSAEEINFILQLLGEQPNKSNTYPLLMKIKQQAEAAAITHAPVTPLPKVEL